MVPKLRQLAVLVAAWLVLAAAGRADAQPTTSPGAAPAETTAAAALESEIARFESIGAEWAARTAQLAEARENAPKTLTAIDAEIAKLEKREPPRIDAKLPVGELEAELLGEEQDLALVRSEASTLASEAAGRAERRKQVPELLAAAKARLAALEAEKPPADEPALAEARQRLMRARREAISREIEAYEEELRSYDARGQLLTRRRERARLRIEALEQRTEAYRGALATRRQGEAAAAAAEVQRLLETAAELPPTVLETVQTLAEQNRTLVSERTGDDGLLLRIEDTSRKLERAAQQVGDVNADFELLRRHVTAAGQYGSVGLVLRKTRSNAPDLGKYRRFIRMRSKEIRDVQLEQLALIEQRQGLSDIDGLVERRMAEFRDALTPADQAAVAGLLRHLLETQRDTLDALISDSETYFQKLVDFDARQRELVTRTDSLLRFIDERVLWIPSGPALSPTLAPDARDALAWLLEPRLWGQFLRGLDGAVADRPLAFATALLLLLAAPFAWPRIGRQIGRLGEKASESSCIHIEPTGIALALSLLLAIWGPGLLAFVGWRLGGSADATQFVRCVAFGLLAAACVWGTLAIPRRLLRPRGIAAAHLGWPEAASRELRRHLGWLAAVTLPAVFVISLFELRGEEAWQESVGRLAYLVAVTALFVFNHVTLRDEKGALRQIITAQSDFSLPNWAWRGIHVGSLAVTFVLAVAAALGYYWTALQLTVSLHETLFFLLAVFFGHQLGSRWFLVASRRLALRRWHEAQIAREQKLNASPDTPVAEIEEPELDLAIIDAHTGRTLRNAALLAGVIGVWMIWATLLPAAGALRSVDLWTTTVTSTVELTNAAGETLSTVEEHLVPITLADVLLALLVAAATLALARNLPGLLEISIFRRLRLSTGERYAYSHLGKYAVTLAGATATLNLVGVGWSSIQWLVAAVGIGLGFGLQEIFANFISGLIILFERPIRVGDTVTVGDVSGTVSKIRIRATWITGFDRKELVVPNKEFITGRLVNWSLSDPILRVDIPIGIAYGSDTQLASRVLREVATRNQSVLREPEPVVLFRGFGESSLDFELRVFSPDVAHYIQIIHELHMEIDRAFRAEGIEIAFPQRDVHIRSTPIPRSEAGPTGSG